MWHIPLMGRDFFRASFRVLTVILGLVGIGGLLLTSCATLGAADAKRDSVAEEKVDVRVDEMTDLLASIEKARLGEELELLRGELEAAAAAEDPWLVVKAAFARIPSDPDGAWARLREVTVTPKGSKPAEYWAWLGMADISLLWGIHEQAALHIDRALEIAPGTVPALARSGLLAIARGMKAEGNAILEDVLTRDSGHRAAPEAAVMVARVDYEEGRLQAAREHLEKLLEHHPFHLQALELSASIAESEDDMKAAADHLERAVQVAPDAVDVAVRLARIRETTGDESGALAAWSEVSRRRPEEIEPWQRQAILARELQDEEIEEAALERLSLLDSDSDKWLRRLAQLRAGDGRYAEATDAWSEVLFHSPGDQEALLARARLFIGAENYREAIGDLREVVQRPGTPETTDETSDDDAEGLEPSEESVERAQSLLEQISGKVGLPSRPASGRTPDAVYAAVSRVVNRAYRSRLDDLPALGGVYSVRVTVVEGEVTRAEVAKNTLHDPILEALIFWTIHDARFPVSEGPSEYTLPFELSPGGG